MGGGEERSNQRLAANVHFHVHVRTYTYELRVFVLPHPSHYK